MKSRFILFLRAGVYYYEDTTTPKYRLCLTFSHQYIDQLSPNMRPAVFGNVETIISFRVGRVDAEALAGEFGVPYHAGVFMDVKRYEILVKRTVENISET